MACVKQLKKVVSVAVSERLSWIWPHMPKTPHGLCIQALLKTEKCRSSGPLICGRSGTELLMGGLKFGSEPGHQEGK
jgi:hypothetical protein